MTKRKTTHVRIEKDLVSNSRKNLPSYTPNEIFKVGCGVLSGGEKLGEFIYGKNTWKKIKVK